MEGGNGGGMEGGVIVILYSCLVTSCGLGRLIPTCNSVLGYI